MRAHSRNQCWFSSFMFSLSLVMPLLLISREGGSTCAMPAGNRSAASPVVPPISITINPSTATVSEGGSQSFIATVTGSSDTAVTWSVQEGTVGGTITNSGVYTAPEGPGTYHIVATSQVDSSRSALATVTVSNFNSPGSMAIGRADHTATLPLANTRSEDSLAINRMLDRRRSIFSRVHD